MRYDRVFLLSFEISGSEDPEVLHSAAALYFKHHLKGINITWYHCKRPSSYDGCSFVPVCSSSSGVSQSVTAGIYAISHGSAGSFGGFKSPSDGAELIQAFMKEAGITVLNQLNLVSCALVNPNRKGASYLEEFAKAFEASAKPSEELKLVAWQAFITIYDMRYLAKQLCDSEQHASVVEALRSEIIQLLEKSALKGAKEVIEFLNEEYKKLIAEPRGGKTFHRETGTTFADHLKRITSKPEDVKSLIGKKVGRLAVNANNKDFFTRKSKQIPPNLLGLVEQAFQLKKMKTFDWAYNVEQKEKFQINNSIQESTL